MKMNKYPEAKFKNKVCIVTGAASGLGWAISLKLLNSGATVVLADIEDFTGVTQKLSSGPEYKFKLQTTDVTDARSVEALVRSTVAEHGRLDYIFNNAGAAVIGEVRDLTLDHWRRILELNLWGVIHGIHYAYPVMISQGYGHIVNTASGYGLVPGPLNSPYVASKCAVVGISKALAMEAQALGVDVSVVCPGFIRTPLVEGVKPIHVEAEVILKQIPVRMLSPEEAAEYTLRGVLKKQRLIVFPFYVRFAAMIERFFPQLIIHACAQQVRAFRRKRRPTSTV